jgi:two-component sensor histidine kinase
MLGQVLEEALPAPLRRQFSEAAEQCREFGAERIFEFELPDSLTSRIFEARMVPDGESFLIIISNISAARTQDAAMRLLMREVSHRSKNLLAIVQSVAVQTARHSDSIEQFLEKFRGRLYALSSTQDLVTDSDWQGTRFRTLLVSQFSRLGLDAHTNTTLSGADPMLGPNAALHIGLALHELGSNARLYGALAPSAKGQLRIDARVENLEDGSSQLIIEWQEKGLLNSASKGVPRFGSLVLERIVPSSVGGSAKLSLGDDQLDYRLIVPAAQLVS